MFIYISFILFVASCQAQTKGGATVPQITPKISPVCTIRNGYNKLSGSCDSYIECLEYQPFRKMCPEGLHYDPNAIWPAYPCGYPMDVPCLDRSAPQPPQPTSECPHQFGIYPSDKYSPENCGNYKMCVGGKAIEMACPTGLAFNTAIGRCDWPDLVPGCKIGEFLGFQCPAAPLDVDGNPIAEVQNYKYEGECFYFFSCELGRTRLLSCDYGFAFDPVSRRCVDSSLVQCEEPRQGQQTIL